MYNSGSPSITRRKFLSGILAGGAGILLYPIFSNSAANASTQILNEPSGAFSEETGYDCSRIQHPPIAYRTETSAHRGKIWEYRVPVLNNTENGLMDKAGIKARKIMKLDWQWIMYGHGVGVVSSVNLPRGFKTKFKGGAIVQAPYYGKDGFNYIDLEDRDGQPVEIDGTIVELGENCIPHRVLWKV
jgi:hypothetical protein